MFFDVFFSLCKEAGKKPSAVAADLGINKSNVSNWKNNGYTPRGDVLNRIAAYFGVSVDYLLGKDKKTPAENGERKISVINLIPVPQLRKIPLLGTIACGEPILAVENIEDEVDMPLHISADFALRCKGDSMINARIFDGDIVYIRQQDIVDNNDIAAVLIGDEATLKRVRLFEDHIVLEPENPKYRPFVYWNEEMNDVRILGKAVAFTSTVR